MRSRALSQALVLFLTVLPAHTVLAAIWISNGEVHKGDPQSSYTSYPIQEKAKENCSHNKLTFKTKTGKITVPYTQASTILAVNSPDITWFCGESKERTGCPSETSHIFVKRSQERRFFVFCLGGEITGTAIQK
jgi:hypothetical protein